MSIGRDEGRKSLRYNLRVRVRKDTIDITENEDKQNRMNDTPRKFDRPTRGTLKSEESNRDNTGTPEKKKKGKELRTQTATNDEAMKAARGAVRRRRNGDQITSTPPGTEKHTFTMRVRTPMSKGVRALTSDPTLKYSITKTRETFQSIAKSTKKRNISRSKSSIEAPFSRLILSGCHPALPTRPSSSSSSLSSSSSCIEVTASRQFPARSSSSSSSSSSPSERSCIEVATNRQFPARPPSSSSSKGGSCIRVATPNRFDQRLKTPTTTAATTATDHAPPSPSTTTTRVQKRKLSQGPERERDTAPFMSSDLDYEESGVEEYDQNFNDAFWTYEMEQEK